MVQDSPVARLVSWRSQLRKSFHYTGVLRESRKEGPWPPPLAAPLRFASRRVLIARGDRFGDMMLSVPFLARVQAAGAQVCVLTPDPVSRALLLAAGVECVGKAVEAAEFEPWLVLFPTTSRNLRSRRHPERWEFVQQILGAFPDTPVVAPSMRRAEAFSFYAGPCVTPLSGYTALSLLDRFADRLGLPWAVAPPLERWMVGPAERARGAVVLNLSAGRPGESDRRHLPIAFWSEVARALSPVATVASIVQPGEPARRAQAEADPELSKGPVACFEDVAEAAAWLGRQRLLISPETGLCHLARNLSLPMAVLTPPRKVPFFYPPAPDARFVFAKSLDAIAPRQAVEAAGELLAQR